MKTVTEEQKKLLDEPLPAEAITPHPKLKNMSSIKAIYVTERLNTVFGVGAWKIKTDVVSEKNYTQTTKNGPKSKTMVVCKTTLEIPEFGIYYECFGGNDNDDYGDAFKGATTDAITKIGSYLGIGADVWKNNPNTSADQEEKQFADAVQKTKDYLMSNDKAREFYLNSYGVGDIAQLYDSTLYNIYEELKKNNKI